MRIVRQLLARGLTVEDIASAARHLHLLEGGELPAHGVPSGVEGQERFAREAADIAGNRIAALEPEIARLSRFRDELAVCRAHVENVLEPASAAPST